jgi:hypothetical protein
MTETESKWAERVRQWRESGKSVAEFTAGQPYKASTLGWWRSELRRRASSSGQRTAAGSSIPMAPVLRRAAGASSEPATEQVLVVEVSGARIRVARGFDAELFTEVVRVLGGAR